MSDKAMVHSGLSASIPVEGGAGRFAELIARLEAAEAGGTKLDQPISEALDQWWIPGHKCAGPWTQSLDAALALAERVLPGCSGAVSFGGERSAAQVRTPELPRGDAKTPALALCAAILKALEAKQ